MSDEATECEECESGAPAWMATFADLMSLLMCFFVLLLSFSEMDVQKYKQVAGSMAFAFGVQKDIKVKDVPKGTSIIKQEFSPGRPDPTPIKVINQKTIQNFSDHLLTLKDEVRKEVRDLAEKMVKQLDAEIQSGAIELVMEPDAVKVRVRENDSFPSGSAQFHKSFFPILKKVAQLLKEEKGQVIVAGHTDNIPIKTAVFPSNWVLSSARAANVVQHLVNIRKMDPKQLEIRAYGDTKPLAENDTAENRAKNRRVEIIVNYDQYPSNPYNLKDLVDKDDPDSQADKEAQ